MARLLLVALGVPLEPLNEIVRLSDEMEKLVTAYDRWSPLTQLGWAITDAANPDVYDQALALLDADELEQAEMVLEDYWNGGDRLETIVAKRVLRVAICSEVRIKFGRARYQVVLEAVDNHTDGRYASALAVVVPQMEGMLRDVGLNSPYRNPSGLTDDASRGGHPSILLPLFEMSRVTMKRTTLDSESRFPRRHGVAHGRSLGHPRRRDSTKALVACAELATFCQARILDAYDRGTLEELDRRVFE